ncbi:MAG: isoprenylcysteine carboxylmethyltransferase family protein [Rhodospirillales bacterium]|nr:isoprenylcysteine carboxylmethyltransferase family protein [Rhodospirillales bacterium]
MPSEPLLAHLIYGLGWLSFGLVHSILATVAVKQRLRLMFDAGYRLAYNLWAVVHIGAVWGLGNRLLSNQPFESGIEPALTGVRLLGIAILLLALREYDLGRFSGLSQIRAHRRGQPDPGDEALVTKGLHQFVRHPLYLGAYMILWGGAVNEFGLATAVWGSLYLAVGARHEEGALLALHGAAYATYQRRVPAVIPWKGKVL